VLVPELSVRDLATSLDFYVDLAGFAVRYARPDEGFACLERGAAELMLDQLGTGRDWITAPLEPPFGRGINLQIDVEAIDTLAQTMTGAGQTLFTPLETRTYQAGPHTITQRQFCVLDPDGYLLRFCQIVS
jgi:catechol 2,3-dioxygenase-like lactoylglutathione lyase family enzyme